MKDRPSWDDYFMRIAFTAALRATCDRRSVGCVLVKDHQQIAMGYNGSPRNAPHCDAVNHGHPEGQEVSSCRWAVHAEMNAIATAARRGASIEGATAYVTDMPCVWCYGILVNAGIKRIVACREYKKAPDYTVVPVEIMEGGEGWRG